MKEKSILGKIWKIIRLGFCKTRLVHFHAEWKSDGIHCADCGFFKSKSEHQADLHAGGGW
jgi:hypothetical protein